MDSLRKNTPTLLVALFAAILALAINQILMRPLWSAKRSELAQNRTALAEAQAFISKRKSYESEWEKEKPFLPRQGSSEEALNLWVKDLLAFASAEGIVFTKLEPQGVKDKEGHKEIRLFLYFQGDIRKLIHFLYFLLEKDPLSRIDGYSMKHDEETKTFSYEFTLAKALL